MANIKKHLENIKGALFGKDVRSSIHDGIDAINKEVEGTTEKQNKLGEQFKNLVINEGNSNAEVAASRGSHDWLPDRLDNFDSQLEHKANKNFFSVKDFGAKGDGKTDDTIAIQNAINYCQSNNDKFFTVYFPDGKYLVNGNLTIAGNIRLKGTYSSPGFNLGHCGSVIYSKTDSSEPLIKIGNMETDLRYGVMIEDIAIYGDYKTPPKRDVIHNIKGGWEFLMRNVFIRFFKGHALYGYNLYDSVIENCSFISCGLDDVEGTYKYTVKLTDSTTDTTDDSNAIKFTNCHFEHSQLFVEFDKAREIVFTSCKFENESGVNTQPTFKFGDRVYNNIFNGCTFMCATNTKDYLFRDTVPTLARQFNFLVLNGCTFVSGLDREDYTGTKFLNITNIKPIISNCCFSKCSGDDYPIILHNASVSNCDFVFTSKNNILKGMKINKTNISNCKIYVHEDSDTFDYTENDVLNINVGCIVDNVLGSKAYDTTKYPSNLKFYTLASESLNSKLSRCNGSVMFDSTSSVKYGDNFKLPLNDFNSSLIRFNLASPLNITGITNGLVGDEVTFYNEGSGTINFVSGSTTYDGTTFRNAKALTIGTVVKFKKVGSQWVIE